MNATVIFFSARHDGYLFDPTVIKASEAQGLAGDDSRDKRPPAFIITAKCVDGANI